MTIIEKFLSTRDQYWDIAGIVFGGIGCLAILGQLLSEINLDGETSLSLSFVLGYVVVFGFWLFYGLRFKRPAIILTNAICFLLQATLLIVIVN